MPVGSRTAKHYDVSWAMNVEFSASFLSSTSACSSWHSSSPGDLHKSHGVDFSRVNPTIPYQAHAVLDAVHSVRNFREVVASIWLLLGVEGAVIRGGQLQLSSERCSHFLLQKQQKGSLVRCTRPAYPWGNRAWTDRCWAAETSRSEQHGANPGKWLLTTRSMGTGHYILL